MAENSEALALLLQACLDDLHEQPGDLRAALGRAGEQAAELRPALEAATWLQARQPAFQPAPEFIAASRQRLMARIAKEPTATPIPSQPGIWQQIAALMQPRQWAFSLVATALLFVVLIFGGGGAARMAQYSIPGDNLYPLKLSLEQTALTFSLDDAGDVRLHTRFASQRLDEIEVLALENHTEYLPPVVSRLEMHVNEAMRLLPAVAKRDARQAQTLAASLHTTLVERGGMLAVLLDVAPPEAWPEIERVISLAIHLTGGVETLMKEIEFQLALTPTPTLPGMLMPTLAAGFGSGTPTLATDTLHATQTAFALTASATQQPSLTPLPPSMLVTPTLTPLTVDDSTPTVKPTKVEKPTKTPKPLPEPTRRPPKPTKKP